MGEWGNSNLKGALTLIAQTEPGSKAQREVTYGNSTSDHH